MTTQNQAYLRALLAVAMWSTVATAFKLSLRYQGPELLVFQAAGTSTLVLAMILFLQGRGPELLTLTWSRFKPSLLLGALNPSLYYLILLHAYDLLPAQEAQAINYTWAITMTILSVPLLKQRIHGLQYLAIGLSYLGALIISTRGDLLGLHFANPKGVILALTSTIIWALFWILGVKDKEDPILRLFLNFCCGTIYSGLWVLSWGHSLLPSLPGLAGAFYIGCFEMGVTYVLWISALKLSRTTAQVSNLIFLAPFLSLLLIHLFLGEQIFPSTLMGLVFILAGTTVQKITDTSSTTTALDNQTAPIKKP